MTTLAPAYFRLTAPLRMRQPGLAFARDEGMEQFISRQFTDRDGVFFDVDHGHLSSVHIGWLWAASRHVDRGSEKAATVTLTKDGEPSKWSDAIRLTFLHGHFGEDLPPVYITCSAPATAHYDDRQFFALIDHELEHVKPALDQYGAPRFSALGKLLLRKVPHEFEGFSGTVARWGAPASGAASVVRAALTPPRFAWVQGTDLDCAAVCGVR